MATAKEVTLMNPNQEKLGRWIIKKIAWLQVHIYRLSGGRLANRFNGGPVALLTMRGRDQKEKFQTLPLVYAQEGEKVFFAASLGGMSRHPNWYWNVTAHPLVEVQIGPNRQKMLARELSEEESVSAWQKLDAVYPDFAEYRERAALSDRRIPLLCMEPPI